MIIVKYSIQFNAIFSQTDDLSHHQTSLNIQTQNLDNVAAD